MQRHRVNIPAATPKEYWRGIYITAYYAIPYPHEDPPAQPRYDRQDFQHI